MKTKLLLLCALAAAVLLAGCKTAHGWGIGDP